VVPPSALPEEPALAELPADPITPGEAASPPVERAEGGDDVAPARSAHRA
jgi:hypothetical protein